MNHYLLYLASPSQQKATLDTFHRLRAKKVSDKKGLGDCYRIEHHILEGHVFYVYCISDVHMITPHLRQQPIDLLIYDERGEDSQDALEALEIIQADIKKFADLWGPDFLFPMSRAVCILEDIKDQPLKPFLLGRFQVRNVCINPAKTIEVLLWLKDVLTHGLISDNNKVGLAMSGGGIEGFLYQIGVLHALDISIEKKSLHDCDTFSGVSSGSICASLMANNVPPREVIKALKRESEVLPDFTPSMFYDLASRKILERILKESIRWEGLNPKSWIKKLIRVIPTGFFKGDALTAYFEKVSDTFGGKTYFNELDKNLFIGATDQDSFETIVLGTEGWKDVKIIEAIRSSCALPPFFTPTQLKGRHFIDGQITGSCNLNEVAKSGCRMMIIIDPLIPYTTHIPGTSDAYGGIHSIIQILKALVYSRFRQTLEHVTERYPDIDFFVFQPDEDCAEVMAGSPMRYHIRTQIIDLAIKGTLRRLRSRNNVYANKLAKYGFRLKTAAQIKKLEETGYGL